MFLVIKLCVLVMVLKISVILLKCKPINNNYYGEFGYVKYCLIFKNKY